METEPCQTLLGAADSKPYAGEQVDGEGHEEAQAQEDEGEAAAGASAKGAYGKEEALGVASSILNPGIRIFLEPSGNPKRIRFLERTMVKNNGNQPLEKRQHFFKGLSTDSLQGSQVLKFGGRLQQPDLKKEIHCRFWTWRRFGGGLTSKTHMHSYASKRDSRSLPFHKAYESVGSNLHRSLQGG